MTTTIGRRGLLGCGLAIAALERAAAQAPGYPARPVRVIVPFAPGGASDVAARIVQPHMQEQLGQPIVVENRAGAAGNIGMEAAARAAPDGYTLFLGNVGTLAVNPAVFERTLRVDPRRDFAAISLVAETADVLVVNPSLPVTTVAEFVAYVRARPGQLNYGSPGVGSVNRLAMEKLREAAGLDMLHVPYAGGAGPAGMAVMAGDVHCLFTTLSSIMGQIQSGRVRALAVSGRRRVPTLPDVPTMAEAGYEGFETGSWQGLLAPAGTPADIIRRLHAVQVEVAGREDVRQRFAASGTQSLASRSPEEFAEFIRSEYEKWGSLVRRIGAVE
ncbi:MAG: tripartite tricarboxylate transporter substrate binding protein [Acetobacteraceae bacterium]|nr:tripartite tricarboxylate transporter substrate binding protein [Acetobacteraceae bacterium]